MDKLPFLPIILGSDENAYGCARLFYSRYRIKPVLICSKPLCATSYSSILYRTIVKDLDTNAVFSTKLPEILKAMKSHSDKLLLIPCSDYYAELTVRNMNALSEYIENPIISKDTFSRFNDKISFYNLCEKHGLPYPETIVSTPPSLLSSMPPFPFPLVIKPSNSNSYSYLNSKIKDKKKVYFCKNITEYTKTLKNFRDSQYNDQIIVQPFIQGPDTSMRVINAYCDRTSNVRLLCAGQPLLEYCDPQSIGNYAAIKPVYDRELCDTAADFLEKIGYTGFANFDIKVDSQSGKFYFLELNPRQGRSSYFTHTAGANLMAEMVEDIIYNFPYQSRKYFYRNGIWSNVPYHIVKKYSADSTPKDIKPDYTLSAFYDFNPKRAFCLLKRDIYLTKMFNKHFFDKTSPQFTGN